MIVGLTVENLALSRGDRLLFSGLSFTLKAGEALVLTGANGSGKTSLLRSVAGFLRPQAGDVRFEGGAGVLDPDGARALGLHWLGHHDGLNASRTAGEELSFWARFSGAPEAGLQSAVAAFALERLLALQVRQLSAGQRRRVALSRFVAAPRPLWLLDEPMAPLDAGQRQRFAALMNDHLHGGGLIVAAVHDPLPIACRVLEIGVA